MTEPTLAKFNYAILSDLITSRAKLLDDTLRDGIPCSSRDLAEELIFGLTPAQRGEALELLLQIEWGYAPPVIGGYLDECDAASYKAAEAMAGILLAEIRSQKNEHAALRRLIADEITAQREERFWELLS